MNHHLLGLFAFLFVSGGLMLWSALRDWSDFQVGARQFYTMSILGLAFMVLSIISLVLAIINPAWVRVLGWN